MAIYAIQTACGWKDYLFIFTIIYIWFSVIYRKMTMTTRHT